MPNVIEQRFRKLLGLPCWNAQSGYGSFLTLEFGQPHLEIREPRAVDPSRSERMRKRMARRAVRVRGAWHLWIYCCAGEVYTGGELKGTATWKAQQRSGSTWPRRNWTARS